MKRYTWVLLSIYTNPIFSALTFRVGPYSVRVVQFTDKALKMGYDLREIVGGAATSYYESTGYKPHIKYYSQGYMMVWPAT